MSLGMVQLGNAARSTPCFNEKINFNFNQTRGTWFSQTFLVQSLRTNCFRTSYYNLISVPWVNKV